MLFDLFFIRRSSFDGVHVQMSFEKDEERSEFSSIGSVVKRQAKTLPIP